MQTTDIESELTSLNTKLVAEIENDTKQIDFLKKRIEKSNELLKVVRGRLGTSNPSVKATGYGSKFDTIKDAIAQIAKPRFNQTDVENEIKRANPTAILSRDRVRSSLWTLQHKGLLIKQVRPGNNRQPAEFEKLPVTTNGVSK